MGRKRPSIGFLSASGYPIVFDSRLKIGRKLLKIQAVFISQIFQRIKECLIAEAHTDSFFVLPEASITR